MTVPRILVSSHSPFEREFGFSRAVRVGSVLVIAGTAPIADDGSTAGVGDLYLQTLRCFEISRRAIEEAGGTLENVVRTRMMLTDVSRWKEASRAHGEFFRDIRPAATCFGISSLINPEWLIETEVDCFIPE